MLSLENWATTIVAMETANNTCYCLLFDNGCVYEYPIKVRSRSL